MDIKTGQNLYNAIDKICGFIAFEDEMSAIIEAIKLDNPTLLVKNNFGLADVIQTKRTVCSDCADRGWIYNKEGEGTGIWPIQGI